MMKKLGKILYFLPMAVAIFMLSGWEGAKKEGEAEGKKGKVIKANTIPYRDDADYSEHNNDMYLWEE